MQSQTARTVYFDNAATSHPKPELVYEAADRFLRHYGNPGRGAHKLAVDGARAIFQARETIAHFLGIADSSRLIFTPGCTYSLNTAIRGLLDREGSAKQDRGAPAGKSRGAAGDEPMLSAQRRSATAAGKKSGKSAAGKRGGTGAKTRVFGSAVESVVTTALEHNSVMRPLHRLEKEGRVRIWTLKYDAAKVFDFAELQEALQSKPLAVVLTEASNVTGQVVDIPRAAEMCARHGVPLIVDAAQTAGRVMPRLDELGSLGVVWCASGHKGLMGAPGAGLLYVPPSIEIPAFTAGGTGSRSESLDMPGEFPDKLEAGTMAGPAIAAMEAGVRFIEAAGVKDVLKAELNLAEHFVEWCQRTDFIEIFGRKTAYAIETDRPPFMPVVSFKIKGLTPSAVADHLDVSYGIGVRAGLHCAAVAHRSLGTTESGLVRASFGYYNTMSEVDYLCQALTEIHHGTRAFAS